MLAGCRKPASKVIWQAWFSKQIASGPFGVPKRSSSLPDRILPLEDIYSQISSFSITSSHRHPRFPSDSLSLAQHWNPFTGHKGPGSPYSLRKMERWMFPGSRNGWSEQQTSSDAMDRVCSHYYLLQGEMWQICKRVPGHIPFNSYQLSHLVHWAY